MELLALVMGWIVALFVAAAGVIVLIMMYLGKIDLQKLISEENGDASMSRFQLLIFTFVISMSLFLVIVSSKPIVFPAHIPGEILALLGISGGSYLASKGIQASKETNQANIDAKKTPGNDGGAASGVATPNATSGAGSDQLPMG